MTPAEFTKFLYAILDYKTDIEPDLDLMWVYLKVSDPVVNTLAVTTNNGEQFLINVKKVSK